MKNLHELSPPIYPLFTILSWYFNISGTIMTRSLAWFCSGNHTMGINAKTLKNFGQFWWIGTERGSAWIFWNLKATIFPKLANPERLGLGFNTLWVYKGRVSGINTCNHENSNLASLNSTLLTWKKKMGGEVINTKPLAELNWAYRPLFDKPTELKST